MYQPNYYYSRSFPNSYQSYPNQSLSQNSNHTQSQNQQLANMDYDYSARYYNDYYNYTYNYNMPLPQNLQPVQPVPAQQAQQPQQAQNDMNITGGVSAILDYDLENMSKFISWISLNLFENLNLNSYNIKNNNNFQNLNYPTNLNTSSILSFESSIKNVLTATRLPKSTIILSLNYLNEKFSNNKVFKKFNNDEIFLKIIISLILGNKFNDDNTFSNKSWSGATGLSLKLLNKEEREWLYEINWSLSSIYFEKNLQILEKIYKTWNIKVSSSTNNLPSPISPYSNMNNINSSPISISKSSYNPYLSPNSSPICESPYKPYKNSKLWFNDNISQSSQQLSQQYSQQMSQQQVSQQSYNQQLPLPLPLPMQLPLPLPIQNHNPPQIQSSQNIWSFNNYNNSYHYNYPAATSSAVPITNIAASKPNISNPSIAYGNCYSGNFVGYTNPYYGYNLTAC